eukprot:4513415-Pleurochrysis_carterae.AAC.1
MERASPRPSEPVATEGFERAQQSEARREASLERCRPRRRCSFGSILASSVASGAPACTYPSCACLLAQC